ncbi:histidine--tRNA ligase [Candidatus Kaiserbacteria bacterium RIFCSPHIGHO2_02_FULL_49_34]|uniref:Histidine--tRNA ligase n=1 Tax=Candidatus Kaiserbacteria bacterium RIFCSPHIGHO2_02_FULL_49_34 TaxID=1798491 RepID=A0A1F6DJ06_9BACT|nr:MAG: histidine--tRNA ligase [Candidatus Kaiserbacteria bacterium RIFCSPHIGHO2_02_FULL_49_34]
MEYLSTQPYKGVRDFYPKEMAVQRYIFDGWAKTAERFGYECFGASIFEPSALYKAKGQENEEMVNEQTYTFTDRGDREVTLRPELTPSVARMVAGKRHDLHFPIRWYSIPNLYRYERPQRGRLREFWQLNADVFGDNTIACDIDMLVYVANIFKDFGATLETFVIRVNDRGFVNSVFDSLNLTDEQKRAMFLLLDKKNKITAEAFDAEAAEIIGASFILPTPPADSRLAQTVQALHNLGLTNVIIDPAIVRGFNYYTGLVFEIYDTNPENSRALGGGGRYDNLTEMFGGEPITGIGFGMGDVSMVNFLTTHNLLPEALNSAATLAILPLQEATATEVIALANTFRTTGITTIVDATDRKLGKKLGNAGDDGVKFALILGSDEIASGVYALKHLASGEQTSGTAEELIKKILS